jgi:hypothetical protein
MAFESEQRIPNAVESACGAMKFALPSAAMQLERKIAKASAAYVLFLHVHCVLIYFCIDVAQVNERELVCLCSADMATL